MAFRTLLRSIHRSAFFSPVSRHFDSIEQARSCHYRVTLRVKRCFGWKNGSISHNSDREERNTPIDVCVLKYPESEIGVGGIQWCMSICANLGRPIITNATSENDVH
jgi:hypothetical protein